jgi:ribonuclease HII
MQQLQADFPPELVAGVDEAGRGPLAGPVVAAAVILHPERPIAGLRDSKKLTAARREALEAVIRSQALCWSVAWSERAEIDALNILAATMLAMRRAILGLSVVPRAAIVGGDNRVESISAASILAKTARDRTMVAVHARYPDYEFARHKGYGTELHRARLLEHGPCPEHRRSFAPVRALT